MRLLLVLLLCRALAFFILARSQPTIVPATPENPLGYNARLS